MRAKSIVVLLLALFCFAIAGNAQEVTGQIRGTVTDSTGAVVPNAAVTITNLDRNQVIRTVKTNGAGEFVAPLLPVGKYSVAVEAPGFKKYQKSGIDLNVSDRLIVDAALQAGGSGETV